MSVKVVVDSGCEYPWVLQKGRECLQRNPWSLERATVGVTKSSLRGCLARLLAAKASRLKKDTTDSEVGGVVGAFGAEPSAGTNYQEPSGRGCASFQICKAFEEQ